jgi:hypothetical protein
VRKIVTQHAILQKIKLIPKHQQPEKSIKEKPENPKNRKEKICLIDYYLIMLLSNEEEGEIVCLERSSVLKVLFVSDLNQMSLMMMM